ncbi:MAG: hypothetical protein AAGJ83_07605, partial [Planctomycetota bacterium]
MNVLRSSLGQWRRKTRLLVAIVAIGWCASGALSVRAQDGMMSDRFVPADALALLDLRPSRVLGHDMMRLMPTEVLDAWTDESVGIRVGQVRFTRVVIPMPTGPEPDFGIVVAFNEPVALSQLKAGLIDTSETFPIDGKDCYAISDGSAEVFLHVLSPTVWILATRNYMPRVIDSSKGGSGGSLSQILADVPVAGDAQFVIDMKPLAPMIAPFAQMQMQGAPPFLRRLPELIPRIDAAWNTVDLARMNFAMFGNWTIKAKDEQASNEMEAIFKQTLDASASQLLAMAQSSITKDDSISVAMRSYLDRLATEIKPMLMMQRDGLLLKTPTFEAAPDVATVGVLVGLLLPAVQAAR